jgi:16S rRNA processing protein RimM
MLLTVGRIGRVHGIHGEVTVQVLTDSPEERFYPGAILTTNPERAGGLTITSARWHNSILLLGFEGVTDRNAGEALRNLQLLAEVNVDVDNNGFNTEFNNENDEYHIQQLMGLQVFHVADVSGVDRIGEVSGVITGVAQDLLEITKANGKSFLIPFVKILVPKVDIKGGRLLIDPPGGLIDED